MRTRQSQMLEVRQRPEGWGQAGNDSKGGKASRVEQSWWLLLFVVLLVVGGASSTAQPIKPAYNIGDYEYLIGGYDGPDHSDPDAIWGYMDSLGVVIPFFGNLFPDPPDGALGVLLDTTDVWWRTGRRFVATGSPQIFRGGFGREVEFYPFDSVQSTLWPSKFMTKTKGTTDTNFSEGTVREQVYSSSNDLGEVASKIGINAASLSDRTLVKNQVLLSGQHTGDDPSRCGYFVVTGHLFAPLDTNVADNTPVFRIAVYHQVAPNQQYLNNSVGVSTAGSGGLDILVDSFAVTKAELKAGSADIDRYREVSHRSDLWWRPHDSLPGPLHPSQPNGREQALDIRVYWTGAEKAALRSVAFRDSLGELVLGKSQNSVDFRDSIVREARMILQGSPTAAPTDPIHPAIFRLEAGHENNACSTAVARLLNEVLLQKKASLAY